MSDPLLSDDVDRDGEEDSRVYARGLAEIRQADRLTQRQLAALLRTDQGTVSRIERRSDLLLSTVRQYLAAMGAQRPKIVAEKDGREIVIALDSFTERQSPS